MEAGHCSLMPYSSRSRDRRRKRVRHRWLLWGGGASQARALCLPRFRCPQRKQGSQRSGPAAPEEAGAQRRPSPARRWSMTCFFSAPRARRMTIPRITIPSYRKSARPTAGAKRRRQKRRKGTVAARTAVPRQMTRERSFFATPLLRAAWLLSQLKSAVLYCPLSDNGSACKSTLMKCIKAEKLAGKTDRATASGIERSRKADVLAAPSESNELELPEQSKGKPLGMVPGDAAEKPVVALRPAGMTLSSFLAGKQIKAGKKERPTPLAQTKASAAEQPAKVTAERTASKANRGHLSDKLLSLSAGECSICARNATFTWIGQDHRYQPDGTAACTSWMVMHLNSFVMESVSEGHLKKRAQYFLETALSFARS